MNAQHEVDVDVDVDMELPTMPDFRRELVEAFDRIEDRTLRLLAVIEQMQAEAERRRDVGRF